MLKARVFFIVAAILTLVPFVWSLGNLVMDMFAEDDSLLPEVTIRHNGFVVIDAHSHLSPRALPDILDIMNRNGIYRIVNLSGGFGEQFVARAEAFRQYTDRVLLAHNPDWSALPEKNFGEYNANLLEEDVKQHGAVALKINKGLGLYWGEPPDFKTFLPVDSPLMDPLWKKAGELGVPVYIHTGDPKAFWEPVTPENERYAELKEHPSWSFARQGFPKRETLLEQFENVVKKHKNTRFIGVHFGNDPEDIGNVERMLDTYPNLYVDIAARIPEIGRHDPDKLRALFIKHQDRILFGTDIGIFPQSLTLGSSDGKPKTKDDAEEFFNRHWRFLETDDRRIEHPTPIQGDWLIDAIDLPKEVLRKVYAENAIRLIPQLAQASTTEEAVPSDEIP